MTRRCAMSLKTLIQLAWPSCKKAPHAPTTYEPRLPKKDASAYKTSCIAVPTTVAEIVACGPWNWPHRSVSSKESSPQRCPPKVCVEPSNDSKRTGNAPSTGLPVPTHCICKKNLGWQACLEQDLLQRRKVGCGILAETQLFAPR